MRRTFNKLTHQAQHQLPLLQKGMHQQPWNDFSTASKKHKRWGRALSAITAFSAFSIYQTLPDKDSYARQQFDARAAEDGYLRWGFILVLTGILRAISTQETMLYIISGSIEHYMEFRFHTVFVPNVTAEGKNHVFFRGETKKEADSLFNQNRLPLPFSLMNGEFYLPYVKDPSLEKVNESETSDLPNGYSKGAVSLTCKEEITLVYGNAEACLIIVPKSRIAAVAHHALKEAQNFQYEYICGGIRSNDILGIGYRDPETSEFIEFRINPHFDGDISNLELDAQMQPLIDLLPDTDKRKAQLQNCVNPDIRYEDFYDNLLATDEAHHKELLHKRIAHINTHGFNGNPLLRSLHHLHAKRTFWRSYEPQPIRYYVSPKVLSSETPLSTPQTNTDNALRPVSPERAKSPTNMPSRPALQRQSSFGSFRSSFGSFRSSFAGTRRNSLPPLDIQADTQQFMEPKSIGPKPLSTNDLFGMISPRKMRLLSPEKLEEMKVTLAAGEIDLATSTKMFKSFAFPSNEEPSPLSQVASSSALDDIQKSTLDFTADSIVKGGDDLERSSSESSDSSSFLSTDEASPMYHAASASAEDKIKKTTLEPAESESSSDSDEECEKKTKASAPSKRYSIFSHTPVVTEEKQHPIPAICLDGGA